jgi:lauroyl/myristoyl acyltransferase
MIPSATVVRLGMAAARVSPPWILRGIARAAGRLAWAGMPRRRAVIRENMQHYGASEATAMRVIPNMLEAAVELWRLPSLRKDELSLLVEATGLEYLRDVLSKGRGAILATGHLGPYELAGGWLAAPWLNG